MLKFSIPISIKFAASTLTSDWLLTSLIYVCFQCNLNVDFNHENRAEFNAEIRSLLLSLCEWSCWVLPSDPLAGDDLEAPWSLPMSDDDAVLDGPSLWAILREFLRILKLRIKKVTKFLIINDQRRFPECNFSFIFTYIHQMQWQLRLSLQLMRIKLLRISFWSFW